MLDAGPRGRAVCTLPLIGEFNVANALCAAGIALGAGIELDAIANSLATAPPVPGRMARVDTGQPFSVVVDYAHTPEAMEKVLTLLRGLHPSGRVIAVFGSAGERDVEKRPLQGAIAARLADVSVITSEDPRFEDADAIIAQIAVGAEEAGAEAGQVPVLPHRPTGCYPTRTRSREPGRLCASRRQGPRGEHHLGQRETTVGRGRGSS